jgi:hypothetical protein
MGNQISSLFVHLPVPEDQARYELQVEEAETLKSGTRRPGRDADRSAPRMPPVVHSFVARSMFDPPVQPGITNVPGPQAPLYCFGSKIEQIWPLVPIAAEHAIGLAVFSYDGTLYFCLNVDRDSCRDLRVLVSGISESLEELRKQALTPQGAR